VAVSTAQGGQVGDGLAAILPQQAVVDPLIGATKKVVLEHLADRLARQMEGVAITEVLRVLMEREKLGSTGIGGGIAIPHGKIKGIDHPCCAFGRSTEGIAFDAMDGAPVHLFFAIIAPADSVSEHLRVLARISRLLKIDALRHELMAADNGEELYSILTRYDEQLSRGDQGGG